ncbi:MAG: acetyl-CoA carboxylase biotin carboxyl carrier protein [Saccharofermentanales bacterium]
MDTKLIKEIIDIVERSSISELEIEEGGCRIRVGKSKDKTRVQEIKQFVPAKSETEPKVALNDSLPEGDAIPAPMIGVFYTAASPDAKPFVKTGDKISKGDVLCIIEAMKLMNEITADKDGEIVEICAINGQVVEFGQTIFRIA